MSTQASWQDEETAQQYQNFTENSPMYQELSAEMLKLADIQSGQRVLDVGCGTGVSTRLLWQALSQKGQIYALDQSAAMLALARNQLSSDDITYIHAPAEACAEYIQPPVDRVICNSVFWQIRDKVQFLSGLRQILDVDALLVFNIPEKQFINQHIPHSASLPILFRQLAAERYGVGAQDLRTMRVFLENQGFLLQRVHQFERIRPADESHRFLSLPAATAWMEPPLDYATRLALLAEAEQLASSPGNLRQRWLYFVARLLSRVN